MAAEEAGARPSVASAMRPRWGARALGKLGGGGNPPRAWSRTRTGPGVRRAPKRTHDARAQAAAPVRVPRPPQRPLGGARWGPALLARSFTYSKRHPCGRPTAPTFWALLPFPSPAGAPGTPTSSAPSRPTPGPAAAAAAAWTPGLRRLSCLRRRRRHLPWLFRPAGPHPPPPAGRAPALPPSQPPPRARQPPLGGPAPPTRPRAGPRAAQALRRPRPAATAPLNSRTELGPEAARGSCAPRLRSLSLWPQISQGSPSLTRHHDPT